MEKEEMLKFEQKCMGKSTPNFKKGRVVHFKWYGLKDDVLLQFGSIQSLFESNPDQILFESYDHNKVPTIFILFFDNLLNEIECLSLSNGWKIGRRLSGTTGDIYEITDPMGVCKKIKMTNLYSKAFKFNISKLLKYKSFSEIENNGIKY